MHKLNALSITFLFVCLGLLGGGCGQRSLSVSKTYPAAGRVTLKGEPAAFVLVTLKPTDKKGVEATGKTNENGEFELRTFSNTGDADGAVRGDYNVVLTGYEPVKMGRIPPGSKPTEISGEMDTGISVQITDGDNNLTIDVP
jgi:hypothetical protein